MSRAGIYCCYLFLLAAGSWSLLASDDSGARNLGTPIRLDLSTATHLDQVQIDTADTYTELAHQPNRLASLTIPLAETRTGGKLRIELSTKRKLRGRLLRFWVHGMLDGGEVDPEGSYALFVLYNLSYDFSLPDQPYDAIRIGISDSSAIPLALERVSIVPETWIDHAAVPYGLSIAFLVLLLTPGSLLFVILFKKRTTTTVFLVSILGLSCLFYAASYGLFHVIVRELYAQRGAWTAVLLATSLAALISTTLALKRGDSWRTYVTGSMKPLGFLFLAALIATLVLTKNTPLPIQNLNDKSIAGPLTFNAFTAHDGAFQYVNGKVLADNEPFRKYYGVRARPTLLYFPEDREILPGAIYAQMRGLMMNLSNELADSFLAYALLGMCFNLFVLLPLFALAQRYLPQTSPYLVVLCVTMTAFFIGNSFMPWFKLAGAGLFLSGLYVLLDDWKSTARWALAGLLFGAAANMHGIAALGIPLVFVWFVWRNVKLYSLADLRWLLGPLALCLVFLLCNLPWNVIKTFYFHDTGVLIKFFFLKSVSHADGMWASINLFFQTYPLEEQLAFRSGKLLDAFLIDELRHLWHLLRSGRWNDFMLFWDGREFSRIAMLWYPVLSFLMLAWLTRKIRAGIDVGRTRSPALEREMNTLLGLGFATIIGIILMSYTKTAPDQNAGNAIGMVVLVYILMIIKLLRSQTWIVWSYYAYLGFAFYRLSRFI